MHSSQRLLYVMNPNKFRACEYLVNYHVRNGDKVLIFSDNIFALEMYAETLRIPFLHGKTSTDDRALILDKFLHDPK
jgi:DNA excision repair protein ERCC-3